MCNTSDWIHCNKNPTLHRHPQNHNQSLGCPFKLAEKEPLILNFQIILEKKKFRPLFWLLHMIFLYLFPCVKTWNYEQLLGGTLPRCLLPLHFLCFPTPIFFSGLKLLLAGVKQPIQSLNGYLNGEICMNQNQRGTYALYRAIFFFPIRVSDAQQRTPSQTRAEG